MVENYIEAVKEILSGNSVKNLDELRVSYNKEYNRFVSSLPRRYRPEKSIVQFYTPEEIIVSFVADAENKIIAGQSPEKIYSISETPENFRKSGRKILENWLDKSIHKLVLE